MNEYPLIVDGSANRDNQATPLPITVSVAPAPAIGQVPHLVAELGSEGKKRFTTFFTDNIRNKNTRDAYFRAAFAFFNWADQHGLTMEAIESFHVSAYVEVLILEKSTSTVKQHLAAIRMLFDWLIIGQVVKHNPAHAVRGPKHVVTEGLTPILDAEQMKLLLDSIDTANIVGLRDRALIGVMTATFGRVEAVLGMDINDYFQDGKHWSIRLHEKNGKVITMPVQHRLEAYLDAYIQEAGGVEAFQCELANNGKTNKKRPLFRTAPRKSLTENRMTRQASWKMIKRRAKQAGLADSICNHSFRGTGITNYLENGGDLREAQRMAGHSNAKTTGLYDRRNQKITRGEVERITILG